MRQGTFVELLDGRQGTVVYRSIDGEGGIWGFHRYVSEMDDDILPKPEFMLRSIELQGRVGWRGAECVGEDYIVIHTPLSDCPSCCDCHELIENHPCCICGACDD